MDLLLKMLGGRKALSLCSLLASALVAAVTLWWNAQLGGMINAAGAGIPPAGDTLLWALVTVLAMGVAGWLKGYVSGYACECMTHDLRMGFARHLAALPVAEAERRGAGEAMSMLQNEIAGVSGYLGGNLFQLADDGVRFLSTFGWLLFLNPTLTLAANLPAFLLVVYVVWSSKIIGAATGRSQKAKGDMNQYADMLLSLFPVVRLYDAARMALHGYTDAVKMWERQTIRAEWTRARLMSLSALLSSIPLLLLFLLGGQMAMRGAISIGTLYIFINLSGNVSGVLMNMPGHVAAFRQFSANMKRLAPYVMLAGEGE